MISFTFFLSLCSREVFLKFHAETCFHELKMATTSEEFATYGFDIRTYFYLKNTQDKKENKTPQPKGRNITLVSDNKISEVWAYFTSKLCKMKY